jgi:hypothetical protein
MERRDLLRCACGRGRGRGGQGQWRKFLRFSRPTTSTSTSTALPTHGGAGDATHRASYTLTTFISGVTLTTPGDGAGSSIYTSSSHVACGVKMANDAQQN